MEQVVTHLQQEVFTLKAQVGDQIGLADAVLAINNLATAQGKKDTPNPIDVKGLGRRKAFSGKEEDCQQWSKKTEASFVGVILESETMLEWLAEQSSESRQSSMDFDERGARSAQSGVRAAADADSTRGSHEL